MTAEQNTSPDQQKPAPEKEKLRIVFMGTPDFAVAALDALVKDGWPIVGVVTAPDKPAGRGLKLQESAVKKYAVVKGLTILQPDRLKAPQFLEALRALEAQLQVVVAFRMLPEVVWNHPPLGTINVHASLLPQYRGAAPINWAVINGEEKTGVTTFKLQHEIDTGNLLLQEEVLINPDETAGELHDKLKEAGAQLLVRTVQELFDGTLQEKPQQSLLEKFAFDLNHAPKLNTDTCRIDFTQPVSAVHNKVRGLSPYPGAFTHLHGKTLKIYRSEKMVEEISAAPGDVDTDAKSYLRFACSDGWLLAKEVQLEGKARMPVDAFLRGYRFA